MTFEFSIEMGAERIVDPRSRSQFQEVRGTYNAGYYRSTVVMLWSVVVCDLLFKLNTAADVYDDKLAKGILTEIDDLRQKDPESSKWELKLLQWVKERLQLLDAATYQQLVTLQKHRHLSAHPVQAESELLFSPSQDVARAHMREALTGLLTKPAMLTRKILNSFLEDLSANSAVLPDMKSVESYIKTKYLPFLNGIAVANIFRCLWKFVFLSTDANCEANREVNLIALSVLYEHDADSRKAQIHSDAEYFSSCLFADTPVQCLSKFLQEYPDVFPCLNAAATVAIKNHVIEDFDRFATAWYLHDSPRNHAIAVATRIEAGEDTSLDTFRQMEKMLRRCDGQGVLVSAAIKMYARSSSFAVGDRRFAVMIRPLLADFQAENLRQFLELCEQNSQVYGRYTDDYVEVKERIDSVIGPEFDLTPYPRLARQMIMEDA